MSNFEADASYVITCCRIVEIICQQDISKSILFLQTENGTFFCCLQTDLTILSTSSSWPRSRAPLAIRRSLRCIAMHWIDFCQTYINLKTLPAHLNIRSHCFIGEHPQGQVPISRASPKICFWRTMLFEHLRCLFFRLE